MNLEMNSLDQNPYPALGLGDQVPTQMFSDGQDPKQREANNLHKYNQQPI